jgi:uncharacterized protein YyaL (SSP411 family)
MNKLADQTSPYLLQHANNPVDWYPWGEEALSKARKENKPILLSIGYSACHWCHVMAHESFEDEETAKLMNENFVNIKVDREERPDLDSIYMSAVQLTTGSGGWPMTVFLTPDQVPFYCGTYFPHEDRYGMPSFRRVLISVAQAYREKRDLLCREAEAIAAELRRSDAIPVPAEKLDAGILDMAATKLISNYDSRHGGFGGAPKFPPSMALTFLMRSYKRTGDERFLEIVDGTLTRMASGGIYDQLGGGFHRYSVDSEWLVPHFEKMLYDNALLSRAYLDGYLITRNELYKRIAREVLDYVAREMTSPEGGFYSSQDADSGGKEGAFFVWSEDEVKSALGENDAELFCRYFGITSEGNFEKKNILHVPRPATLVARLNNIPEERLTEIVRRGTRRLLELRETRVKPGRDEKILTSWNGLMLRSFAEAANVLDSPEYRRIALRNAGFLLSRVYNEGEGRLFRTCKDGRASLNGYLEDYACVVDGLISLYEADFDPRWVRSAQEISRLMVEKFWDPNENQFYFTAKDHEPLIHRPKDFNDNATPSGTSAAAFALLRLWKLTGEHKWGNYAASALAGMAGLMTKLPAAFANWLCALDFYLARTKEIAVSGNPEAPETRKLLNEVFRTYLPNKVVACGSGGVPLLEGRTPVDGVPAAYVCENFNCRWPVTSAEDLSRLLND